MLFLWFLKNGTEIWKWNKISLENLSKKSHIKNELKIERFKKFFQWKKLQYSIVSLILNSSKSVIKFIEKILIYQKCVQNQTVGVSFSWKKLQNGVILVIPQQSYWNLKIKQNLTQKFDEKNLDLRKMSSNLNDLKLFSFEKRYSTVLFQHFFNNLSKKSWSIINNLKIERFADFFLRKVS